MINLGAEIGPTVALSRCLDWIQGQGGLAIQVQSDTLLLLLWPFESEKEIIAPSPDDLYGVTRVA